MFYVYEWYVVETGDIFYVGKGIKRRYKCRNRNRLFNEMIAAHECASRIVAYFDNEKDAYEYEYNRIQELRSIGQCTCNISDGGTGGSPECWTPEMRAMFSEHNIMKDEFQRERMRKHNPMQSDGQRKRMSHYNPMKDRDIAKLTNSKKKKSVIIDGKMFDSIKAAMDYYQVSRSTILGWCDRGVTTFGATCTLNGSNNISAYTLKNNGQKRSITYMGEHFESATALAKHLGVAQTTVSRWCRNRVDPSGNEIKYDDDHRIVINPTSKKNIPIIVNGVWYPSKNSASIALNISSYLLTQYLDGARHDNSFVCRYGNQQPSQGNSSYSTLEGSTTNG